MNMEEDKSLAYSLPDYSELRRIPEWVEFARTPAHSVLMALYDMAYHKDVPAYGNYSELRTATLAQYHQRNKVACFLSNREIADLAVTSEDTVKRATKTLIKLNLIEEVSLDANPKLRQYGRLFILGDILRKENGDVKGILWKVTYTAKQIRDYASAKHIQKFLLEALAPDKEPKQIFNIRFNRDSQYAQDVAEFKSTGGTNHNKRNFTDAEYTKERLREAGLQRQAERQQLELAYEEEADELYNAYIAVAVEMTQDNKEIKNRNAMNGIMTLLIEGKTVEQIQEVIKAVKYNFRRSSEPNNPVYKTFLYDFEKSYRSVREKIDKHNKEEVRKMEQDKETQEKKDAANRKRRDTLLRKKAFSDPAPMPKNIPFSPATRTIEVFANAAD